ncbi:MAG: cytochrome C [Rhodospirillaceae bacterium]|mgnify:CR=1 FL=1|jgi:cytochrome subunit of sulfide dehydrogenase|nr:cytochrome C [Rhodospirillaceae bacterium]MBT5374323.1 cytochrome C [Rhodospirillaceae bacterium]MBT5658830.1 cytochrome C [Rhodospirillaceae bacterium]MBT5751655.1 cytochrome C [Rhodospirillaceae bacterium]
MPVKPPAHFFLIAVSLVMIFAASASAEETIAVPKVGIIATTCTTCHGEDGRSPGSIPSLAGKGRQDIIDKLRAFKSGDRPSTIMGRIMVPFDEGGIDELATYFAARTK